MLRRHFLQTTAAAAPFILSGRSAFADEFGGMKKRVGLIGTGWYGKADLLRLVQVAPVEVVSLCDVDSVMLKEAGDLTASRQLSKKNPAALSGLSGNAQGEGSGYRPDRHP